MSGSADDSRAADTPAGPRAPRPIWITVLVGFAGLIVLANFAAFLYARSLPDRWDLREEVLVDAAPEVVWPLVATPGRWPDWSAFSADRDASLNTVTKGPEAGAGAIMLWQGDLYGAGQLKIVEADPSRVEYAITMHGQNFSDGGEIYFEPESGGSTRVVWVDGGPLGDTMSRLFGSVIESGIRRDVQFGLGRLKTLAEAGGELEPSADEDSPFDDAPVEAGSVAVGGADE